MSLVDYLASLNTADNSWGLWVNPYDVDDYRIGQRIFENGGESDGKVYVGALDKLSYGYQDLNDAVKNFLENQERKINGISEFNYKGKLVRCNTKAIITALEEDRLDCDFEEYLLSEAADIAADWSRVEADAEVDSIREFFAEGGEYWRNLAEAEAVEAYV